MKKDIVDSRLRDWDIKKMDLKRLSEIQCEHTDYHDGEGVRIRFDPLSLNEGLQWHKDEGIVSFEITIDVDFDEIRYAAEFCQCGGHAVAGRAPAWIFPSNPVDNVDEERIPSLVLQRINCVLAILSGEEPVEAFKAWHRSKETGWGQSKL